MNEWKTKTHLLFSGSRNTHISFVVSCYTGSDMINKNFLLHLYGYFLIYTISKTGKWISLLKTLGLWLSWGLRFGLRSWLELRIGIGLELYLGLGWVWGSLLITIRWRWMDGYLFHLTYLCFLDNFVHKTVARYPAEETCSCMWWCWRRSYLLRGNRYGCTRFIRSLYRTWDTKQHSKLVQFKLLQIKF